MSAPALTRRLAEADSLRTVREALTGLPGEAWIVGGAVRDAILGRPLEHVDVDVVVKDDAQAAARAVARAVRGPVFPLSEEFGAWRALDRDRQFSCDVSPLQGETIDEDLRHRDFTVNAVAVPLEGGEPIDPTGGIADLEAGVLRVLGPGAYAADPLRPLRLVRLSTELGLAPDAETERLTRDAAPRLTEPAPERIFGELRRILIAPGAAEGLELAERLGVLPAVLPEIAALRGVEQSRFHHLDVYEHTLEVLRRQIELEGRLEELFGEAAGPLWELLKEPLADDLTRLQALRLGALFHDVAKPGTRGMRPDGRVTFIGHDSAGEEMAATVFRRLHTSERLRGFVGALARHHLVPGFLVKERPLSTGAVYAYLKRCEPVEVEVTVLSCADRLATRGENSEKAIAAHLELARELIEPALAWRAAGPPKPPLRGDELMAELAMEPGPELGELLERLEEAAYTGEAATREQALALARRLRQDLRR
ncbi:MAG: HD domain-containing protein [Thermoleophilaceae bacterium]|nr:HD domain-containing protein [Thermoleophilaceae bacterium]